MSGPTAGTVSWTPTARELDDLEMLLLGAYAPLCGFLAPADAASVDRSGRLVDGTAWPVAVTLTVPGAVADRATETGTLELLDEEGTPIAGLKVRDVGDAPGGRTVAGELTPLRPVERGEYRALRRRADLEGPGRGRDEQVVGVPVRRPMLTPEIAALRLAAERLDKRVLLLPLVGRGSPTGTDAPGLVRCCLEAADLLLRAGLRAEVVPVPLPRHGRGDTADTADAALAATVARAYGASRVHGLPDGGPDTGTGPRVVQDRRTGSWESPGSVPAEHRGALGDRDVERIVEQAVRAGTPLPSGLVPPRTERELRRGARLRCGVTVLFTGLSGSGKSTLAKAVHTALVERSDRSVTLLDGDVVRSMLSAGLGFSRADRELNVRRIGYVAAEINRHGGVALCAPIAPYAGMRAEVRAMVEEHGTLVLVHVNTSIEVCEQRDRKGLYAKARRGEIACFTGVSDPYEEPTDADLSIDTSTVSIEEAVEMVLAAPALAGRQEHGQH